MAQEHLDRLTAIDASFLHQEGPSSHMHVGAVARFEGPPPPFDELLDSLRMRLHLVPRYRQKLADPAAGTGRPLWVDDPTFNLEYHVRQTALPAAGHRGPAPAARPARIFSQQLDRSKPLWEMWIVEGLEDGGFALISKTHHAMIDGIAGVDLAQVLFDLSPVPADVPHPDEAWQPAARADARPRCWPPARSGSCARAVRGARRRAVGALRAPGAALAGAREAAEGLGEIVWAGLNPAPETPLNVEIGPHRRYRGRAHRARRLQGGQERVRRDGQRRRAGRRQRRAARLAAARAACGPRASSCARSCRSRSAAGRPRRARQPHRRDARPAARSTSRTRSSGCASVARGDGRAEGVQAGGRRRGARRACRTSRRRRSSRRRRG